MRRSLFAVTVTVLLAASCASSSGQTRATTPGVRVAAAFYPIEEILHRVGGDLVDVVDLTPPGAEAHDVEMTAKQLEALHSTVAAYFLGQGFQKSVQRSIESLEQAVVKVDLLRGIPLLDAGSTGETLDGGLDPHVWLSPANMIAMTNDVAASLSTLDTANAATYRANAEAYVARLTALDETMASGLRQCVSRTFVTNHRAFGYLTDRYGLTQIPIAGLSPDDEPSTKQLEAIAAEARRAGATVIFVEENLSPALADTLAGELGISTTKLQTLETLTTDQLHEGVGYVTAQEANLSALRKGLNCA